MAADELRRLRKEIEEIKRRQRELDARPIPPPAPPPRREVAAPRREPELAPTPELRERREGRIPAPPRTEAAVEPEGRGFVRHLQGMAWQTEADLRRQIEEATSPALARERRAREAVWENLRRLKPSQIRAYYGVDPFGPAHPPAPFATQMLFTTAAPGSKPLATRWIPPAYRSEDVYEEQGVVRQHVARDLMDLWQRQLGAEYPWSQYGRDVLQTVPWVETGGGYWGPGAFEGYPYGRIAATPGFAATHEYAHAAAVPWWTDEVAMEFLDETLDWLGEKDYDEMDAVERTLLHTAISDTPHELVAVMAQYPQYIPPRLAEFFPQYDLTRRRAMGVRQPLGVPPPPKIRYPGYNR